MIPAAPIGPPTYSNQHLLVSDLLDQQTKEWDLDRIRLHLPQYEEAIRLIIPSTLKPLDKQVWLPDVSGSYTTKSGYKRIFEEKKDLTNDQFNWMKTVWKLQTSPKIRHFLWRALHNALPVGTPLTIRGITSELKCKRCGELETISHLLLDCRFAAEVWAKAPLVTPGDRVSTNEPFRDWLSSHVSIGVLPPTGLTSYPLVPWLLWNLWTARNKLIFEDKIFQVEDIISKAVVDAREWERTNVKKATKKQMAKHTGKRLPSTPCWTDGAWKETELAGGMGWIIKNAAGEVLGRGAASRSHVSSALMAEALAMREALKKAKELDLQSLQVFSDSQVLITTLCSGGT